MNRGIWSRVSSVIGCVLLTILALAPAAGAASGNKMIGINVVLDRDPGAAVLADLGRYGKVRDVLPQLDAVTLQAPQSQLQAIRALPYVIAANPDAERRGSPVDTVAASDLAGGRNTFDLDAVDVTDFGAGRTIALDGTGVYVAVLDSGLLDSWRQYFPEERIATGLAKAFSGGGGQGTVSDPPNQWEHDQNSHGTHVTSTVIGYNLRGTAINGVAPKATVIPVKVLNQAGFGWSSVIARGIVYATDLKISGALGAAPLVLNMSLGGSTLDAVEKAAVDYAVANGVTIVASAGNEGESGMGFPGAYEPVISAAASGWIGQWLPGSDGNPSNWWNADNVPDPTAEDDFYIADFSSRELAGQDLDVAAPGAWTVGPYQLQSGTTSYFFLSGTSMASPHVAGIVALMLQKNPGLGAGVIEGILEGAAIPMAAGCRNIVEGSGPAVPVCWGADATGSGLITATAALAATP